MHKLILKLSSITVLLMIYTSSSAQEDCGAASIDSAEYRYQIGRFEECIEGLNKCLNNKQSFNYDQKVRAYYLLANCYLAIDLVSNADSVIEELLLQKENFETDLRDPEDQILFLPFQNTMKISVLRLLLFL